MKIVKASWVSHDAQPIYSIDVQRGDQRFATGGQTDNGSGLVIIWNLLPLTDEKFEKDENNPKILSRLENHAACVNCVRWSTNGKFLATAGDDQIIMIWQYAGKNINVGNGLSGKANVNHENWKCTQILRGHTGDVLHLSWSPQDIYLASCSIDNTVIVWDAGQFPTKVTTLEGHCGFVKGVCWDPVGKYLATQSDDKSLKIWSTSNWTCVKTVKKPFEECGSSTHFLRLDWSTDGSAIISAHALNNGGPVAKVVARKTWDHEREFVGHRKAVTCIRFSSGIYEKSTNDGKENSNGKKPNYFTVCAVGSKDKSVSVWSTAYLRPVVVMHDLFARNVMDLSWSTQNGYLKLFACSSDGSVAMLEFTQLELGKSLSNAEKQVYLKELHGTTPASCLVAGGGQKRSNGVNLVDDPRILKLQNEASVAAKALKSEQINKEENKQNTQQLEERQKQVEVRTKDGKRKIQPIFLGSSSVTEDPALKQAESSDKVSTPEKLASPLKPTVAVEEVGMEPSTSSAPAAISPISQAMPVLSAESKKPKTTDSGEKHRKKRKRRPMAIQSEDEECPEQVPTTSTAVGNTRTVTAVDELNVVEPRQRGAFLLKAIEKQDSVSVNLELAGQRRGIASITCDNEIYTGACKLKCEQNATTLWQTVLPSSTLAVAASSELVAVVALDRSLVVLSISTGRQLSPRIMLDSTISRLTCTSMNVVTITTTGQVCVWTLKNTLRLTCKTDLADLILNGEMLENVLLSETGCPSVDLSDGKTFSYVVELNSWILLADRNDPVGLMSSVKHSVGLGRQNAVGFSSTTPQMRNQETKNLATLSYLENLVNSSLALRSKEEYKCWVLRYAEELARDETNFVKLKNLCQSLFDESRRRSIEGVDICRSDEKKDLLNQILPIVARNPKLCRIYSEFREQLDAAVGGDFII